MRRTTIVLPERLLESLRLMAAGCGTSMASLIHEALEEKLAIERPHPRSIGVGASGHSDTARRTSTERPVPRSRRWSDPPAPPRRRLRPRHVSTPQLVPPGV